MHRSLNFSASLLLPAGLLSLLIGGSAVVPPPGSPHDSVTEHASVTETIQRKPASLNPHQIIILHAQYRFYLQAKRQHGAVQEAAAYYNQCVSDSDPSVMHKTNLPRRL